ncbi:hypothetical protein PI125_g20713 [Phytophthora idaei]|nr:hypothetical protein PI125_g20713 [Phytophthora idaei]
MLVRAGTASSFTLRVRQRRERLSSPPGGRSRYDMDPFYSPSALQSRVPDQERQVAQLQGQLDLLRLQEYAPRSVVPPLAAARGSAATCRIDVSASTLT